MTETESHGTKASGGPAGTLRTMTANIASTDITVVVTGAGGFLGSHVVRALRELGVSKVLAGVRPQSNLWRLHRVAPGTELLPLDVTDASGTRDAFLRSRPTHVIHAAGYGVNWDCRDPDTAVQVNVLGTIRVLNAASAVGARRFVQIGSLSEYGPHSGPISEDTAPRPVDVYGSSKAAATVLVQERAHALGIQAAIARVFWIWGPLEPPYRLVPQVIRACTERRPLDLTDGEQIRDISYVRDMARWIVALTFCDSIGNGAIVNLASDNRWRLRDFIMRIAIELGGESFMRFGAIPRRPNEMPEILARLDRAKALLGPMPATTIQAALAETTGEQANQNETA